MMNGVYFIVIALLVAELFKILVYANEMTSDVTLWTQNNVTSLLIIINKNSSKVPGAYLGWMSWVATHHPPLPLLEQPKNKSINQ